MRSDFDPLRSAPLPDSFDRTAAWLRETPPPRRRRAPAVALVALLVVAGAWSWPVRTTVAAGSVIEVLSADPIGEGHPTLRTLDELVPDEHQHLVELDDAEEEGGEGRVLRYAVLGARPADVDRWRDSVAALPGTQAARVLMIDVTQRRPLGIVTARRVLGVSPTPHLTDAELQAELYRVFSKAGSISIRVQRTPDGQRRLQVGEHLSLDVEPGARVSPAPTTGGDRGGIVIRGGDLGRTEINGRPVDSLLARAGVTTVEMALDSLPRDAARRLRDRLNERFLLLDSLPPGARIDTVRHGRWILTDTLRFPAGARLDSLHSIRSIIRIRTSPDSL